jgi:MoaA/NifB/PqqE/SkfB family radical SAM enzyme
MSVIWPFSRSDRTLRRAASFLEQKREAVDSFLQFARGGMPPRFPLEIYLEVSNVCDLRCVMCPRFSAFNPARKQAIWDVDPGFLETDPATLALGPLLEHALVVHAFGYGEPTIHPSFPSFLEHVAQYEVLIDFFTNGMHLTEALVKQLVELSIFQITVSFSGATAGEYENVYQGGDFERVLSGLARLRDAKHAAGSAYPRVHINSLSFEHHLRELDGFVDLMARHGVNRVEVTRLLEHDSLLPQLHGHAADFRSPQVREAVGRAKAVAAERGVELSLYPLIEEAIAEPAVPEGPRGEPPAPLGRFKEIARALPVLPRSDEREPKIDVIDLDADSPPEIRRRLAVRSPDRKPGDSPFYCMEPFKTFYLRRGGQVKTCCYMVDSAPAFGDIRRWTGEEIWKGGAYETVREAIVNGQYPLSACGSCLANRQAPASHGAGLMMRNYLAWNPRSEKSPLDTETANWLDGSTGFDIVSRIFATQGALALPEASARAQKLVSLIEEDLSWSAALEGWVDHVSERGVAGWLWSPLFPDLRLPVTLLVGDRRLGESISNEYRPDLVEAGKGDGRYGFSFPAPLSREEMGAATVRIGDSRCAVERIGAIRRI